MAGQRGAHRQGARQGEGGRRTGQGHPDQAGRGQEGAPRVRRTEGRRPVLVQGLDLGVHLHRRPGPAFVTGTGFDYQTEIDKIADGGFSTELSPERIDLIDVDRIFVINDKADTDALKKFELFNNLPAVKNGKVSYLLDSEGPAVGAAMSQGTLLSLPYAIDQLVASVK